MNFMVENFASDKSVSSGKWNPSNSIINGGGGGLGNNSSSTTTLETTMNFGAIGGGSSGGGGGGGQQQQQAAAAAATMALFNRYASGGVGGIGNNGPLSTTTTTAAKNFADMHPSYQQQQYHPHLHQSSPLGHHHPHAQHPHHPHHANSSATSIGFNENEFPSLLAQTSAMNRAASAIGFGGMSSSGIGPPPGAFGNLPGPIGPPSSSLFGSSRSPGGSRFPPAYANLMKQVESQQPEFQIHNEDFPALPGSQILANKGGSPTGTTASGDSLKDARFSIDQRSQQQQQVPKRGIQTHQDGSVSGIPAGMLNDQFGMVGLLTFLRAIETDPSIVSLALGHDLTQLGLNLNAPEKNLYQTFGGPWSDVPCRPQDIDCHVPNEYMTNSAIADKLAPIKLNRYGEDLLFFLFYNFGGEVFQLAAAAELYNRDWRYHKEERIWLSRAPGMVPMEKSTSYERGTYYVFDPSHWRKVAKEMHLEYDKLEDRPMLPPQLQQPQHLHHQPSQSSSSQHQHQQSHPQHQASSSASQSNLGNVMPIGPSSSSAAAAAQSMS